MQPSTNFPGIRRTGGFDIVRLLFALLVILAHSPEMIDGNRHRELLGRFVHGYVSLGDLAVDGFFLLSGYLITQSWLKQPEFSKFAEKRLRRIVPGFVVAYVLSVIAMGLFAAGESNYFYTLVRDRYVYTQLLALGPPPSPPILTGMPYPYVDGAMWTIQYELRCYLLVAVLGLAGFFRRRTLLLATTVFALAGASIFALQERLAWNSFHALTGSPDRLFRLGSIFLIGSCFYVFQDRIPYRKSLARIAACLILVTAVFRPDHLEPVFAVCASYLLFYAAGRPWFQRLQSPLPDISYGLYLYAWPIASIWLYRERGSPWLAFLITSILAGIAGFLSWTYIEEPFLKRKQKAMHGADAPLAISRN